MSVELQNVAPASNSVDVRRDWSLTVDVVDTTVGIEASSVSMIINGASVTISETSITNGYRVEYTPGTASSYGERITVTVTATPTGGSAESITWRFTITAGAISATSSPPPYVAVVKDIGLSTSEADETHEGVNVIWLDDITSPLIVTEAQAEAVGAAAVNDNCYHKHQREIEVYRTDDNGDALASLREGDLITFTATAIGETAQKAQVMAIRQTIDKDDDVLYRLEVEYYEAI